MFVTLTHPLVPGVYGWNCKIFVNMYFLYLSLPSLSLSLPLSRSFSLPPSLPHLSNSGKRCKFWAKVKLGFCTWEMVLLHLCILRMFANLLWFSNKRSFFSFYSILWVLVSFTLREISRILCSFYNSFGPLTHICLWALLKFDLKELEIFLMRKIFFSRWFATFFFQFQSSFLKYSL